MKQSCYLAKVCDGEFNKEHIGSLYFQFNCVYMNKCSKFYVKKCTKLVLRCWGLVLDDISTKIFWVGPNVAFIRG